MRRDLNRIDVESLTALVGTFGADREALERVTRRVPPLTDDWPVTEYSLHSNLVSTHFPDDVLDVREVRQWCPHCFENGRPIPEVADLPAYLGALDACYRSEGFRFFTTLRGRPDDAGGKRAPVLPPDGDVLAAIRLHPYLYRTFLGRGSSDQDVRARIAPCHLGTPPPELRDGAPPGTEVFRSLWPTAP